MSKTTTKTTNTNDDLRAQLAALQAENDALRKAAERPITMKVAQKGGLSLYGFGRFPITQYKETWLKILDMGDDIRAFIKSHPELSNGKTDPRFTSGD